MSLNRDPRHAANSVLRTSFSVVKQHCFFWNSWVQKTKISWSLRFTYSGTKVRTDVKSLIRFWLAAWEMHSSPSLFLRWTDLPTQAGVCEPVSCHTIFILKSEGSGLLRQGLHKHWGAWASHALRLKFKHFLFKQVILRVIKPPNLSVRNNYLQREKRCGTSSRSVRRMHDFLEQNTGARLSLALALQKHKHMPQGIMKREKYARLAFVLHMRAGFCQGVCLRQLVLYRYTTSDKNIHLHRVQVYQQQCIRQYR